jgi:hypothetical protein
LQDKYCLFGTIDRIRLAVSSALDLAAMSTDLICSALGLRPDQWPPDHYILLGLPVGDVDPAAVEGRVLDRMERLRRYQLAHPDAVTDAMNRLAQALVCLSDPAAKRNYDATLRPMPLPQAPPLRVEEDELPAAYPLAPAVPISAAPVVRRPTPPAPRRDDARQRLYHRVGAARRLLAAWREVGNYIGNPDRRPRRPAEAVEFVGTLLELRDRLAATAAPVIGLPSQAGALVAALARQPLPLTTYRQFLPEQRTALAADWRTGEERLAEEYRAVSRAVRRHHRTAPQRAMRKVARAIVSDRLDLTLFVLGLLALGLALIRSR